MANSGYAVDVYPGRPSNDLILNVSRYAVSGNQTRWAWTLTARKFGATSYVLDSKPWGVNVLGQSWSGSSALDFRNTSSIVLGSGVTGWVNHNSVGDLNVYFSAYHNVGSIFGNASLSGSFSADRLATVPPAPTPLATTPDQITATSMRFQFSGNGSGGSAIIRWEYQYSTTSNFSAGNSAIINNGPTSGTAIVKNLTPNTTYYFRARGVNALGNGAWSSVRSGKTLVLTPPTFTTVPTISGTGATVTLQGSTSDEIASYDVEYEYLSPAPIPSPATRSGNTTTGTLNVSGLVPGATYRWRARTNTEFSQSAWSAWTSVTQPKPSTSPGDYFDGASQPTDDQTFSWTGTANNSTSRANGVGVLGWAADHSVGGGTSIVQRVTGGFAGTFAGLLTMISDATAAGVRFGVANVAEFRIPVQPGTTYVSSGYVSPGRVQRLAAGFLWLDGAGAVLSATVGDGRSVPVAGWTRLVATAQAPVGAAYVLPFVTDVTGTDWSLWLGGDSMRLDALMVTMGDLYPYFDGATPDDGSFAYSWTSTANRSTSVRSAFQVDEEDLLVDPDCAPVPSAPLPPVVESDCIDEVGIWRRYWVSIPASEVANWQDMIPTVELETGPQATRQIRIRVYPNPFSYPTEQVNTAEWCSEQIISYMPPRTVMTLDGVMQRVWAAVNGREAQAADHLLYGTGGVPATWPVLSCGVPYLVSLDVPLDAPESNLEINVALTARW